MRDLKCEIWLTLRRRVLGIHPFVKAYLCRCRGRDQTGVPSRRLINSDKRAGRIYFLTVYRDEKLRGSAMAGNHSSPRHNHLYSHRCCFGYVDGSVVQRTRAWRKHSEELG